MDKKYIAISVGLIVFMIITIISYNLFFKEKVSEKANKGGTSSTTITVPTTTNGTILCTRSGKGDKETIEFVLNNNTLDTAKFKFTRSILLYGYDDINTLSQENKNNIQNSILKDLGYDSLYNNGVEITIEYTEDVVIYVYVNFNIIGKDDYEKLGIEFTRTNFNSTIKQLVSSREYTCK